MRRNTTETHFSLEENHLAKTTFTLGLMYVFSQEALPAASEVAQPFLRATIGEGALYSIGNAFLYMAGLKIGSMYTENAIRLSRAPIEAAKNWIKESAFSMYLSGFRQVANMGAYFSPTKYYFQLAEDYFSHREFGKAIYYYQRIQKPEKLKTPVFTRRNHLIESIDELIQQERAGGLSEGALDHLTLDERTWARAQYRLDEATILKIENELGADPETLTAEDEHTLKSIVKNNPSLSFDASLLISKCYIFAERYSEALDILLPYKSKIAEFLSARLSMLEKTESKKSSIIESINTIAKTEYQPINELLLLLARLSMEGDTRQLKATEIALSALMSCRLDEYHFIKANREWSKLVLSKAKFNATCLAEAFFKETIRLIHLVIQSDEPAMKSVLKSIINFIDHFGKNYFHDLDKSDIDKIEQEITHCIDHILLSNSTDAIFPLFKIESEVYEAINSSRPWKFTLKSAGNDRESRKFNRALKGYQFAIDKMEFASEDEELLAQNQSYLIANYRAAEMLMYLIKSDRKMTHEKKQSMMEEALDHISVVEKVKNKPISDFSIKTFNQLITPLKEKLETFVSPPAFVANIP